MAPLIQRRPSRVIVDPRGAVTPVTPATPATPATPVGGRRPTEEAIKPTVGFATGGGRQVLLRVRVSASADVHFTTTISV